MWAKMDPILEDGEPGYEFDTGRFKIGNGKARWTRLPYFTPATPLPAGSTMSEQALYEYVTTQINIHANAQAPHPVYDDGPSLLLLYLNAKV